MYRIILHQIDNERQGEYMTGLREGVYIPGTGVSKWRTGDLVQYKIPSRTFPSRPPNYRGTEGVNVDVASRRSTQEYFVTRPPVDRPACPQEVEYLALRELRKDANFK
jgi:hypothetical protein